MDEKVFRSSVTPDSKTAYKENFIAAAGSRFDKVRNLEVEFRWPKDHSLNVRVGDGPMERVPLDKATGELFCRKRDGTLVLRSRIDGVSTKIEVPPGIIRSGLGL